MPRKKIKKRKKKSRMRGSATHGGGARKKRKKSGHRGGSGMSGTGKRGDHKKTLITKKYGNEYFGKRGITSRKTEKDKRQRINLQDIKLDFQSYLDNGIAKKTDKGIEINLKEYKILGKGDLEGLEKKGKIIISAEKASKSALEKVKKIGGEIILPQKKEKETSKDKKSENNKDKNQADKKAEENKEAE